MSEDIETFEATGAGSSLTYPEQASAIKKGGHVVIKGKPCKVVDISSSKTGKHGHAKINIVAIDIFTQKKYEDVCPASHNVDVPNLSRIEYQLLDIDDEGFMYLMDQRGQSKDDIKVPTGEVGEKIQQEFDSGKSLVVAVLSAMNTECAVSYKESKD
eukprot:GHVP01037686.1.p3 GENE.GHVP01037686.1~~GHVP01037686.1.p3  ORF type:complete len:157 (+),score=40.03 GHVP01037686.1:1858-2328(+)